MLQKKISSFFTKRPSSSVLPTSVNSFESVTLSTSCDSVSKISVFPSDQVQLHSPGKLARLERPSDSVFITKAISTPVNSADARRKNESDRSYLKKWENPFPWLYEDTTRGGAFCKLCEIYAKDDKSLLHSTGGLFIKTPFCNYKKALGKDGQLTKHAQSASHINSVKMEKFRLNAVIRPIHSQIINQSESERNRNRESLSLLLRGVYFLAKEEIVHTTKYEPLVVSILRKANPNLDDWVGSQSERSTYVSRNKARKLVCSVGEVLKEVQREKLKGKKFALMADESTSVQR